VLELARIVEESKGSCPNSFAEFPCESFAEHGAKDFFKFFDQQELSANSQPLGYNRTFDKCAVIPKWGLYRRYQITDRLDGGKNLAQLLERDREIGLAAGTCLITPAPELYILTGVRIDKAAVTPEFLRLATQSTKLKEIADKINANIPSP
jgi:hypothetical protein